MNWLDRALAGLLWLLGVLFVAATVHIIAIFALPRLEGKDAFARLSAFARPVGLTLLPAPGPEGATMPFADPAIAQGVCLFDLARGAVRLRGKVEGDRLLTLSFRAPSGEVFYSMTDRAAQHGKIDVLLLSPAQLETLEAEADDDEDPPQELRLVAPTRRGIILVNSLAVTPSERPEAEEESRRSHATSRRSRRNEAEPGRDRFYLILVSLRDSAARFSARRRADLACALESVKYSRRTPGKNRITPV